MNSKLFYLYFLYILIISVPEELPEIKNVTKKIASRKKSKELRKSDSITIEEVEKLKDEKKIEESNQNFDNINIDNEQNSIDQIIINNNELNINGNNESWSPKDYKTKGFPHGICSPKNIFDMDKLMDDTKVNDIAIEENRINEAKAADAAESIKYHDVIIEEIESVDKEPTVESTIEKLNELSNIGKHELVNYI